MLPHKLQGHSFRSNVVLRSTTCLWSFSHVLVYRGTCALATEFLSSEVQAYTHRKMWTFPLLSKFLFVPVSQSKGSLQTSIKGHANALRQIHSHQVISLQQSMVIRPYFFQICAFFTVLCHCIFTLYLMCNGNETYVC